MLELDLGFDESTMERSVIHIWESNEKFPAVVSGTMGGNCV